ncbi:hypothetical protein GWO13_08885 [Candidatus Bathyarchaeota archaeon]|nr:hypothetical protein [Candidatus Bathyarchaeota archaeon]
MCYYLDHKIVSRVEEWKTAVPKSTHSAQAYLAEQVEKLEQKLSKEIEAKLREELRMEYEQKLREQVRKIVLEEMWQSDPQTRYIVEDRVQTNLGVKPDRADFKVQVAGNEKIINIKGYWKNGKYYPIPDGLIKIKSPMSI